MQKLERKEMFKIVAETFKNLGFEVSKNKRIYVIEYPEVYVRIGIDACRGSSKLIYNLLFKSLHQPCDYFNEGNYDSLGSIIEDIVDKIHLKGYKMIGKRLDLGN